MQILEVLSKGSPLCSRLHYTASGREPHTALPLVEPHNMESISLIYWSWKERLLNEPGQAPAAGQK